MLHVQCRHSAHAVSVHMTRHVSQQHHHGCHMAGHIAGEDDSSTCS